MIVPAPPPQYDVPTTALMVEVVLPFEQLARFCGPKPWACSKLIRDTGGNIVACTVYLPPIGATRMTDQGMTRVTKQLQNDIRRHEHGHCNGWHHPQVD